MRSTATIQRLQSCARALAIPSAFASSAFACHQAPSIASPSAGTQASPTSDAGKASSAGGSATTRPNTPAEAGRSSTNVAQAGNAGASTTAGSASQAGRAGAQAGQGQSAQAGASSSPRMGFQCPAGPFAAPVPSGATVKRIAGLPPSDAFNDSGNTRTNIEGPVWIGDKLYVSEFPFLPAPTARVLALDPVSGNVSVVLENVGTNGLAVDMSGALIATDHKNGAVVRMPFPLSSASAEVLTAGFAGKRFDSPNDLAVRSDGTLYFSDPDYQAPSMHPQDKTRVYRLSPGTGQAREPDVIDDTRSQPNGVTLSADEKTLYVAGSDGVFSYPVSADGSVMPGSGKRLNAYNGGADGLGMDCAGNLYVTATNRVAVLSAEDKEIGSVPVSQAESVTNIAFGGPEHKTLFVTSMGTGDQRGVFSVELNVPGFPY